MNFTEICVTLELISTSLITSSSTSFRMRCTNEMKKERQLNTIRFVKRVQNDDQDEIMRDAK